MTKFTLKTTPFPSGLIEQELISDDSHERLWRFVTDTREQHFREALVKLGWTPPHESEKEKTPTTTKPKPETHPTCPTCRNFTLIGEFSPCNTCTDRDKWIGKQKLVCFTCANEFKNLYAEPCSSCTNINSNWQPKGDNKSE